MQTAATERRTAALLVDAGYVWKQVARAVGREHRRDVELTRYGVPLIEALVEEAEGDGMAVLRTYWYDGAPDRLPNVQQRTVGRANRVKLRLGNMSGGRQKGVDRLMQRDIIALAGNKAVTDLVVLTGDQDMEEELDAAGQHGLLVHLWGIADRDQQDSISGRLLRIVDDWKVLPSDWAAAFVPEGQQVGGASLSAVPLSSDRDLTQLRSRLAGEEPKAADDHAFAETSWTAEKLQEVGRIAYDTLKGQYGAGWHAIRPEIASTTFATPSGEHVRSIPGKYDTELMDAAEAITGQPMLGRFHRVEVRTGFWQRLDDDI